MRLLRVDIEEFRSIKNQGLPATGLVILFGANSAGKTSVLEAVEQLITQAAELRADPGESSDLDVMGSVRFDLPGAAFAGSEDARLYRSLLCGEYARADTLGSTEDPWGWLRDGLTAQLKDANLSEATSLLADALASTGSAGSLEDRELLARFVFDPSAAFFTANILGIDLAAFGPSMSAEAMDAARRIASVPDGDDPLLKVAADLVSNSAAHICQVGGGAGHSESFAEAFPPVIVLDGNTESLSAELQQAVPAIHDLLWHAEPEVLSAEEFSFGAVRVTGWEEFEVGWYGAANRYSPDGWLEGRSEEGEPDLPSSWGPYDQGDWYRVRHSIRAAAKVIEAEANRVAPGFVTRQGTIGIEILPVSVWGGGLPRVRATFTEPGQETRDLTVVGAGTARWAAAAARLACRRLQAGRQVVADDAGTPVEDAAEKRRIVRLARSAPFTQQAVHLEPSDAPAVYIADEPEAHLHPTALHSVRKWLTELAEKATTVLVATHSYALLDSTSELVNRVHVGRNEDGTQLRHMTGALDEELERVSEDLGISRGEILLTTRLALFVEGPHDQIILDEWFGDVLRGAGIRVFPVHGVDNLPNLADSEITAALGIRIATLSDDTSPSRASSGRPRTRGDHAVGRLLEEAARAGIKVHPVGLDQGDILYYLDETICRQVAPAFPGWGAAETERRNARSRKRWKRWVEDQYTLPLTREGVRRLARMCRQEHKIPAELTRKVHGLAAYATDASPGT
jgi:energy-coupling factor transporter ATP-binding protein EcfA2